MKTALVIGGTGPTGPYVVDGLLERGYEVAVLHGGQHEVEFSQPVEHIHVDPHFDETLSAGIARRSWWDLVVLSYGRLRIGVSAVRGRTGRVIAVGGINPAHPRDPRWGTLGPPINLREDGLIGEDDSAISKIAARMTEARDSLFQAHRDRHYDATYIAYASTVYGARAQGPKEWCVVRRALDRRRSIIVPDGGINPVHRGYAANLAHGLLLAVDQPAAAAGKCFAVADTQQYTLRQLVEAIATHLCHAWELVDVPFPFALPSRPYDHRLSLTLPSTASIETELGYRDLVPPDVALQTTVEWLLANRPEPGGEAERQLGDPFDYAKEDEIVEAWRRAAGEMNDALERIGFRAPPPSHAYRHPKHPGEAWKAVEQP